MLISVQDIENGVHGPVPNQPMPITITTITNPFTTGGSGSQTVPTTGTTNTGHKSRNHE